MASPDPPAAAITPHAARFPDWLTLAAITVVAGALTTLIHEGLGHGGACWLSGGHNLVISTVNEDCSIASPWIDAAGTLANLGAGLIFWLLLRRVKGSPHAYFFLWMAMTFNFLTAAGYWLFSGVSNLGDWAAVIAGLQPKWLWHTYLVVAGIVVYIFFVRLAAWELKPLLPRDGGIRVGRAQRLMLVPYFTYGVLNCIAGVFNPVGAILILESAAAAAFGGTSGLCWGWQFVRNPHFAQPGPELPPLTRSRAWIVIGALAAVAFIALLGPGWRP